MNWIEIEKKHQKEWQEFEKLKAEAWKQIGQEKEHIMEAFGNDKSAIPDSVHRSIEKQQEEWHKQWSAGGEKERSLKQIQKMEREAVKKKARQDFIKQFKESNPANSNEFKKQRARGR